MPDFSCGWYKNQADCRRADSARIHHSARMLTSIRDVKSAAVGDRVLGVAACALLVGQKAIIAERGFMICRVVLCGEEGSSLEVRRCCQGWDGHHYPY